jgi:cytochrome c oxidase subunit 1
MATATVAHHDTEVHGHQDHHDHEHHDNFITKYLFTTDHKMIAKQFLVTGMFWALIGGLLSTLFRLQLGFPDMNLEFLRQGICHPAAPCTPQPTNYGTV